MPEIGPTLREARMRARIDISEIESETKIRAKYLRALENEEWGLLPGPTYVKTFLRTYAEALDLDAKLLVEEYKLRHESLADYELAPIAPARSPSGPGPGRPFVPRAIPRSYVLAGLGLALAVAIFVLSRLGGGDRPASTAAAPTTATSPTAQPAAPPSTTSTAKPPATKKKKSTVVKLKIVPTGQVYACLRAKGQRSALINGVTLTPDTKAKTFRSSRFRLMLGNANADLRVDGKKRRVPSDAQTADGVFVQITKKGLSALPKANRPQCTG